MNWNATALFGALMLLTACGGGQSNGSQPETVVIQGHGTPVPNEAVVEENAGALAAQAATPRTNTSINPALGASMALISSGAGKSARVALADNDPMAEQRCVWSCLANSRGASDPAYHQCVDTHCAGRNDGGAARRSGASNRARRAPQSAATAAATGGGAWLVGTWAPHGFCADNAITYRANGTYVARSPGGEEEDHYEVGRWRLTGSRITWTATGGDSYVKVGRTASATIMRRGNELIINGLRGETTAVWSTDGRNTGTPQRRCS